MKRTLISCVLTALATAMLVTSSPQPINAPVSAAQATTTKSDLITLYRANAKFFIDWKDANKALRAQYDAHAFSWANGDFIGSNEGITAADFTTAVTNLSLVQAAFDGGGTLSAGFPTTIYKLR